MSESGAVGLARALWEREVPGSNPGSPTKIFGIKVYSKNLPKIDYSESVRSAVSVCPSRLLMGNTIIILGFVLVVIGIFINIGAKLHLPLLPGDILIQKDNFSIYFPIVTSVIISIIATIIINLFR